VKSPHIQFWFCFVTLSSIDLMRPEICFFPRHQANREGRGFEVAVPPTRPQTCFGQPGLITPADPPALARGKSQPKKPCAKFEHFD